jgi:hypothetical protein
MNQAAALLEGHQVAACGLTSHGHVPRAHPEIELAVFRGVTLGRAGRGRLSGQGLAGYGSQPDRSGDQNRSQAVRGHGVLDSGAAEKVDMPR